MAWWQQAITWTNCDPDPWRHVASLGHNELMTPRPQNFFHNVVLKPAITEFKKCCTPYILSGILRFMSVLKIPKLKFNVSPFHPLRLKNFAATFCSQIWYLEAIVTKEKLSLFTGVLQQVFSTQFYKALTGTHHAPCDSEWWLKQELFYIFMPSGHDVSKDLQLNWLFNSLFTLTMIFNKSSALVALPPLTGPVIGGSPAQKSGNAESVSMPWLRHG